MRKIPVRKAYSPMLHIGASLETVAAARAAVLDIVKACGDPNSTVGVEALRTFSSLCQVTGTTISECIFEGDAGVRKSKKTAVKCR